MQFSVNLVPTPPGSVPTVFWILVLSQFKAGSVGFVWLETLLWFWFCWDYLFWTSFLLTSEGKRLSIRSETSGATAWRIQTWNILESLLGLN